MYGSLRPVGLYDFTGDAFQYLSAVSYSISFSGPGDTVKAQSAFYWAVSGWFETYLAGADSSAWQKSERSFNALRVGIDSGALVIADAQDLEVLTRALAVQIYTLPQVIEYYICTGEFMGAMLLMRQVGSSPFVESSQCAAYGLYAHDVATVSRYLDAGDDPYPYMDLPLEVRAELSGITRSLPGVEELGEIAEPGEVIQRLDLDVSNMYSKGD